MYRWTGGERRAKERVDQSLMKQKSYFRRRRQRENEEHAESDVASPHEEQAKRKKLISSDEMKETMEYKRIEAMFSQHLQNNAAYAHGKPTEDEKHQIQDPPPNRNPVYDLFFRNGDPITPERAYQLTNQVNYRGSLPPGESPSRFYFYPSPPLKNAPNQTKEKILPQTPRIPPMQKKSPLQFHEPSQQRVISDCMNDDDDDASSQHSTNTQGKHEKAISPTSLLPTSPVPSSLIQVPLLLDSDEEDDDQS